MPVTKAPVRIRSTVYADEDSAQGKREREHVSVWIRTKDGWRLMNQSVERGTAFLMVTADRWRFTPVGMEPFGPNAGDVRPVTVAGEGRHLILEPHELEAIRGGPLPEGHDTTKAWISE